MHIILSVLTALATLLYVLDRLGIDLGGMNPWAWRRRRNWAKQYEADPIYGIEDPMQVAAVLIVGVAKLDGEITREEKDTILSVFEDKFSLESREARELYNGAAHLLGGPQVVEMQLRGLADRHTETFSPEQADSLMDMLIDAATADGEASAEERILIEHLSSRFASKPKRGGTWD